MSESLECILRRFAEELTAPSTDAMPNRIERMARRYAEEYGSEHDRSCDAIDVLQSIDQLRRDLSGYHGQLKAHNDLQRHCDNQRERIVELEELYAKAKADRDEAAMDFSKEHDRAEFLMRENAKLRELCKSMRCALADFDDKAYLAALDETLIGAGFDLQELGIEGGPMSETKLTIRPFRMGTDKEAALKPLEEASEVRAAWQEVDGCGSPEQCSERCEVFNVCDARVEFADEIADCIQACCNLAERYGIDLQAAMVRCEERNFRRGRYES